MSGGWDEDRDWRDGGSGGGWEDNDDDYYRRDDRDGNDDNYNSGGRDDDDYYRGGNDDDYYRGGGGYENDDNNNNNDDRWSGRDDDDRWSGGRGGGGDDNNYDRWSDRDDDYGGGSWGGDSQRSGRGPTPDDHDPYVSRKEDGSGHGGRRHDRDDDAPPVGPGAVDLDLDSEDEVPTQVVRPHSIADEAPSSMAAKIADGLSGPFEDPDFPATQASLGGEIGKDLPEGNEIVWLRPKEVPLAKNPSLFKDGSHSSDVCQGGVGDCWLCGGLSVIATRDDLIKRVVLDDKHAAQGLYAFKFYLDGVWKEIIVDDRLPYIQCAKGFTYKDGRNVKPMMASSKDPNELWSGLCEKAFAKARGGSYAALDGGYVTDALVDLTGGAPFVYSFAEEPTKSQIADGSFVKQLRDWSASGHYLMSCALLKEGAGREEDQGKGVLSGHAYGILKVVEYKGETLICIRNPWGQTEVTHGKWSDSDKESWTPEALRDLGHSLGDDGTFWMAAGDFFQTFTDMDVCRLLPDDWATVTNRGSFSKELGTDGGCPNTDDWVRSPQYLLKVAGDTPLEFVVSLQQDDVRGRGVEPAFIGFKINSVDPGHHGKLDYLDPETEVGDSGSFRPSREVSVACRLKPGKYIITCMTFAPGEEALYRLHVSTAAKGAKGGGNKKKKSDNRDRDGNDGDRGDKDATSPSGAAFTVKSLDPKNDPKQVERKPPRVSQKKATAEDGKVVRGVPKTVDVPSHAKKGSFKAKKGRIDDLGVSGMFDDVEKAWKELELMARKGCKCIIM